MKIGILAIVTATAAFSLLVPAGSARAGFLLTDANAIPASGFTYNYFSNASAPKIINANVEAAVYSKTGFETSFGLHPEISSADYVYVYQMFNNGVTPNAATQAVSFLSVGISPGMLPYDIGSTNNGDGSLIAPTSPPSFTVDLSSAKWSYTASPFLPLNATSQFLYFASPFPAGTHSASLSASGVVGTVNGTLPSPVPEPATAVVFSMVVGAGLLIRRRL